MAPHTPHDDVYDIAVSPNFAHDGMVFVVCRDMFLKSKDHGRTWTNLVNGLNNMYQYFTDTAQRFSLDISSTGHRLPVLRVTRRRRLSVDRRRIVVDPA